MLLEDALVLRDPQAIAGLFGDGAVIAIADRPTQARGAGQIARLAPQIWAHEPTFLADPQHVVQAHDTALVVAQHAINVVRRDSDGTWRYAISLLTFEDNATKEQT
ncbi:MAG TPA: hypothetical protein VNT54_08110 [Solirubrobacteraceae bacterium]|nr:hypothetical protein [Solirubrobacteraceae bacterium]